MITAWNCIIASAVNYRTTEQLLCRNIINDKKLYKILIVSNTHIFQTNLVTQDLIINYLKKLIFN